MRFWIVKNMAAGLALGASSLACAAHAESWSAPSPDFARYGIRTIVCDRRPHAVPCLGLMCSRAGVALVNAAGGGGPMEGATRIASGRSAFTLHFDFDSRAVDRLGVAVSRAEISPQQLEALAGGRSITLTDRSDPRIRSTFPTIGLSNELRRVLAGCRSGAAASLAKPASRSSH